MAGIGSGVGVVVAQLYGGKRYNETSRAVHTSLVFGLLLSLVLTVVGYIMLEPMLRLLGTQEVYMENAILYLRITFLGIVATAVYNFGASILRATGDSRTPLVIGAISGLINVIFNIFFVCVFKMSVDGVAIATICSGVCSFLATLAATPFVDYIQANGLVIFGMQVYAQQALATVSMFIKLLVAVLLMTMGKAKDDELSYADC